MSDTQDQINPSIDSGSSNSDEPEYLLVGMLHKPHGVRGEMRMSVWTDFPERLEPGKTVYVGPEVIPHVISTTRWHNQVLLIAFEDITDRDEIGIYRNFEVFVETDDLPSLEEGELYLHELIGMKVLLEDGGELLGEITGFVETGANDVYIVSKDDGKDVLIPGIEDVVLSIDLDRNEMIIRPLDGLFYILTQILP